MRQAVRGELGFRWREQRGHPEVPSYGLLEKMRGRLQEYPLVQLPLVDIVYLSKHLLPNSTSGKFVSTHILDTVDELRWDIIHRSSKDWYSGSRYGHNIVVHWKTQNIDILRWNRVVVSSETRVDARSPPKVVPETGRIVTRVTQTKVTHPPRQSSHTVLYGSC